MKLKFLFGSLIALAILCCYSCKKDSDHSQEENKVKTIVRSNTPGAVITLVGGNDSGMVLKIENYYEEEFMSKSYGGQTIATCDDPNVLITLERYVWGKLVAKQSGNSHVMTSIVIKDFRRK